MKQDEIPFEIPEEHFQILSKRFGDNPLDLKERLAKQLEGQGLEINETNLHSAAAMLESDLRTSL